MLFSDDMRELVSLFHKHKVKFAVCGGFAVAHYGFVRATSDFDLLVLPSTDNARQIMKALQDFGFGDAGIEETAFHQEGTAITLGAQPNQVDLLTSMGARRPTVDILSEAEDITIQGTTMKVVRLSDLLAAKGQSERPKDRIDLDELLRLNPGTGTDEMLDKSEK